MRLPLYKNHPEWKVFYPSPKDLKFFEAVTETWIPSGNSKIHLDVYLVSAQAPTVIFCHGLATCGRMMGPFVRPLFERGFNILCPDLAGFGMTLQKKGSGTVDDFVQNIFDVIRYTKKKFTGPRFLTGVSLGGALSYYAATHNADVEAVACYCLLDFSSPETLAVTTPGALIQLLKPILRPTARIFSDRLLPLTHFLNLDKLCEDKNVIELFRRHPLVLKHYTVGALWSLVSAKPKVPFERFEGLPVLVLHGENDRFIPERLSRRNYERLACKKKYVRLKNCEHIPLHPETIDHYAEAITDWFRSHSVGNHPPKRHRS